MKLGAPLSYREAFHFARKGTFTRGINGWYPGLEFTTLPSIVKILAHSQKFLQRLTRKIPDNFHYSQIYVAIVLLLEKIDRAVAGTISVDERKELSVCEFQVKCADTKSHSPAYRQKPRAPR